MTQAMCRGCFQTKECEEYAQTTVMLCKKCWSKGATIAQKAKVER